MPINEQSRVWDGVFASFAEVPYERDVFGEAIWSEKQAARATAALEQLRAGRAPLPITTEYALPVVAATTARPDRPLRVLDFGGALGTSYVQLRLMLRAGQPIEFVVVENPRLCERGASMYAGDRAIVFRTDIPAGRHFDIVHAGSSIHYVDDWRGTIRQLADAASNYLLFADLPAGHIDTFVTTQWFHGRQIPVRFWNVDEFVGAVADCGYELIFNAPYAGGYLERDASLPTSHFDARHRLDRFCQLVFRRAHVSDKE